MSAVTDLRGVIEAAIIHAPRSMQTWAGPSELAISCSRCLVHKLAGTPTIEAAAAPWMPFVGTAVHAELACLLTRHEHTRVDLGLPSRYLIEHRVNVGVVDGIERTGSVDVFDIETGTVIDFKVTGNSTMTKARRGEVSKAYLGQVQLYGKGLAAAGYDVRSCVIWFLPRNGFHLGEAIEVERPFSPTAAQAVLDRANQVAASIRTDGIEAVLEAAGPHTGEEFSCRTYPDGLPVATELRSATAPGEAFSLTG